MSATSDRVSIERFRFQFGTALLLPLLVLGLGAPQAPPAGARPEIEVCELCKGTKVIVCPHCHGDWRNVEQATPCLRKGTAGCNQSGAVKCFRCKGKGEQECAACRGSGYVTVRRSMGGTFKSNQRVRCTECRSSGTCDCEHCGPGSICPKCKRYFTYNSPGPRYCEWCFPDASSLRQQGKPGGLR